MNRFDYFAGIALESFSGLRVTDSEKVERSTWIANKLVGSLSSEDLEVRFTEVALRELLKKHGSMESCDLASEAVLIGKSVVKGLKE